MPSYLTLEAFKGLTLMPASDVDSLDTAAPGWVATQLEFCSAWIDSRLTKRYEAPFTANPPPLTVQMWLARLVTVRCFIRRGVDPNDEQFALIKADADGAEAQIKEAADAENGLFELPLRGTDSKTGVSKGGPFGYSEQSPYVFADRQVDVARNEDTNRTGSY